MVRITARHPSGFVVTLDVEDLEGIDAVVSVLLTRGYRPTMSSGDGYQRTPTGEPICPRHQVAMVKRSRYNGEWFSHKVQAHGRELWCRGYPTGKADDGYLVG